MKKIITTILASLIVMSAMGATIEFTNDSNTGGDLCYLKFTGYPGAKYTQDKTKYSATVQINNGNIIERNEAYNATTAEVVILIGSVPAASDEVVITLTHIESGDCGVATFKGGALISSSACGGVPPADPVSDFTIPAFIETKVGNTNKARATFKVNNAENLSIQLTDNASGFFSLGEPVLPNGGVGDAYIDITFAPTQAGTFTANLSITYNGGSATQAISATAVEAGSSEPGTIEFKSININNAQAAIASSSFINTDISEYSVIAYQNDKTLDIEITKTSNSDILFVNKSGEYYSYPVTFEITNNKDNTCGKLIATSSNEFTQSPCDAATGVSIVSATPGVDYVDLAWRVNGYTPTHAVIYYRKTSEQNYSRIEASPIKPSARVSGLAANTQYDFYVRLEQRNNESQVVNSIESEVVQATTTAATFSIYQKAAYTNYLTIGWDANFSAEVYTVMYKEKGSSLEYLKYELSGKATSATITGLNEHTSYDIQVVAQLTAAQGGSRTAKGIFTTLDRTSCNTVSTESEKEDNSFTGDNVCEFENPYNIEAYTIYDAEGKPTVRIRYQYTQGTKYQGVEFLQRNETDNNLISLGTMPGEGNHWYYKDVTGLKDGDYFYFAVKAVSNEACTSRNLGTTITQGGIYVTRKLNYKVGVGCNDATELEFTKGEGDKVFYLQTNATIARVEVYDPSGKLVATPEITKPGASYVLNIASNDTFPTDTYKFMLYDINGRLSDVKLIYAVY